GVFQRIGKLPALNIPGPSVDGNGKFLLLGLLRFRLVALRVFRSILFLSAARKNQKHSEQTSIKKERFHGISAVMGLFLSFNTSTFISVLPTNFDRLRHRHLTGLPFYGRFPFRL